MRTAILIVGHGSREREANLEFEALVKRYKAHRPDHLIGHGYIELARPNCAEALTDLAQRSGRVILLPLFLFTAGHVKNDIPLAMSVIRRQFPKVQLNAARTLGVHPHMVGIAGERMNSILKTEVDKSGKTVVIVVGRGASDPDANADFCKVVRLIGEGHHLSWILPSFIGLARPLFGEAIEMVVRSRPESIVVLPYFLFGGRLIARIESQVKDFRSQYPWIRVDLAPHLGFHPNLLALMDERIDETGKAGT